VLAALAEEDGETPDLSRWHALQAWLESAEHRVTIPYARDLALLVPPVAVRLRRDFGAVLNLIRAHAVLHQASRGRDRRGRIVATLKDYSAVRELVADLVSEGVEATVPPTVRETVDAVVRLRKASGGEPVTTAALGRELKLDRSAASRRARAALDRGYLKNLEDNSRKPSRLVPGDELPKDLEVLPEPQALKACASAGVQEGIDAPPPPEAAANGHRKGEGGVLYPSETRARLHASEEEWGVV
jgi:hypothetical protein